MEIFKSKMLLLCTEGNAGLYFEMNGSRAHLVVYPRTGVANPRLANRMRLFAWLHATFARILKSIYLIYV